MLCVSRAFGFRNVPCPPSGCICSVICSQNPHLLYHSARTLAHDYGNFIVDESAFLNWAFAVTGARFRMAQDDVW